MNSFEFRTQFDLLYNNINSNAAPSLDDFEVSVFLTMAQKAIVKNIYKGEKGLGLQENEETRRAISPITEEKSFSKGEFAASNITSEHLLDCLSENILFILSESCKLNNTKCNTDSYLDVVPVYYDSIQTILKNPFRRNTDKRILRLEKDGKICLYCTQSVWDSLDKYYIRYIRKPYPIILSNLSIIGETIDGKTMPLQNGKFGICELDPLMQLQIITTAVQLAQLAKIPQQQAKQS